MDLDFFKNIDIDLPASGLDNSLPTVKNLHNLDNSPQKQFVVELLQKSLGPGSCHVTETELPLVNSMSQCWVTM